MSWVVNFRPGVVEKLGLDYASVKQHCPSMIYGEITGYGKKGSMEPYAWPGFVGPVPVRPGLAQWEPESAPDSHGTFRGGFVRRPAPGPGSWPALIKRASCGEGSYVHVSMLESVMDMQFEVFTTYLNDGGQSPERSAVNNANGYINAPYGIYQTLDGYLAIAMVPVPVLGKLISCGFPLRVHGL